MNATHPATRDLRVLTPDAFRTLPAETSPHGVVKRLLLQPGQDVVAMRATLPPNADIPPHGHPKGKAAMLFEPR